MHRSYLYPHNPTFGALSQGRARFFCAKAGAALPFQHKAMLGTRVAQQYALSGQHLFLHRLSGAHEPRRRFAPERTVGFSLNLSWELRSAERGIAAPRGGGFALTPRGAQEGRHLRFPPSCESPLSLGGSGADCRHVTAAKRGTAEDFSYRREHMSHPVRDIFAGSDTVLLHRWFTLRRARHNSAAQIVSAL